MFKWIQTACRSVKTSTLLKIFLKAGLLCVGSTSFCLDENDERDNEKTSDEATLNLFFDTKERTGFFFINLCSKYIFPNIQWVQIILGCSQ